MPSPGGGAEHAFEMHWRAPAVGEFLEAHSGPHLLACRDVASELRAHRCRLHEPRPPDRGRHCFVALAEPAYGRPVHARLVQTTELHYDAAVHKRIPGHPSTPASTSHITSAGGSATCPGPLRPGPGCSALSTSPQPCKFPQRRVPASFHRTPLPRVRLPGVATTLRVRCRPGSWPDPRRPLQRVPLRRHARRVLQPELRRPPTRRHRHRLRRPLRALRDRRPLYR
mmetsp:Transcript_18328/g.41894  ORF Transcript_18328/g.41894 Transcript_18328/m.41894 type:complete len:226 (+) Transcript_18328:412-1089(+)